jgi:2-polyprenyl-6-methoxyphenol hydroxylase-like FAD-dependent oxidoreductase
MAATVLPSRTDVLIVGAGPAGLALAAELTRLGVAHVVLDREEKVQPGTRAAAIQPRTLECLEPLGVTESLITAGARGTGFQLHDGERPLLRVEYEGLKTAYPYMLLISQQTTEEHLERRLHELGGAVYRGYRLLTSTPDHPGVTATVAAPDGGLHAVYARYVVGADGVYSRVRDLAAIAFPGDAPEQLFAIADLRLAPGSAAAALTDTTFFLSPHGMLLASPLADGLHRVVASVAPGTPAPSTEQVEALLAERGPRGGEPARVAQLVSTSTYHVQERVAARMYQGSYFLVGDAAHTHSPAGGQGMNTGIQDAVNLAGKLHAVLIDGAPTATLEAYHTERHPVAERLVAFTAQVARLALVRDPAMGRLRNDVITAAANAPGFTDWLAARLAQLDVPPAEAGTARLR